MGKIGNLWFDVNLKDNTDRDYSKIRKRLMAEMKQPLDVETRVKLKMPPKVAEEVFRSPSREAEKLAQNIQRVQSALDRLATLESRVRLNMKFGDGGEGYGKALGQIKQLENALKALDRNDTSAVRGATGSGFTRQLNEIRMLTQEQDRLNRAQQRQAAENTRRLQAQATEQARLNELTRRMTAEYSIQGGILNRMNGMMSNYLSVYAAGRFLGQVIQIGGEFEKQRIALESILGSASKAEAIFSQIKTLAVESPFEFKELASYTKQLSAFSVPYEELYDTTKRLADISAGLGVDMGRIILAYGQVRSAAFLRGQELRQFTEAGIPLVDELAKKFSELEGRAVSAGEVFDRISRRMVSFEMVKDVLWGLTSEGGQFFEMQERLAESLAGKWSNLRDSFDIMLSEIAEGANGPLKGVLELLTRLMNNWERVALTLASVVAIYGSYRAAVMFSNAATAISVLRHNGLAKAATMAAQALNGEAVATANLNRQSAVMITRLNGVKKALSGIGTAGWIGLAIGAVISLVAWMVNAKREANELRDALDEIGERGRSSADVEIARYRQLAEKIEEAGAGTKERADLIAEMNQRFGNYLPNLLNEADANEKVRESIDAVTEAIKRRQQAESYEEGLSKINEKYTGEMSDLREELEGDVRRYYGFENGEEKSFTRDLMERTKAVENYQEAWEEFLRLEELYNATPTGERTGGGIAKRLFDYLEIQEEERNAISGFESLLNGTMFKGLELYAARIKEIEKAYEEIGEESANTLEAQRAVKLAMYEEMLGVFPEETDDKYINDYKAKIKREIEALMKEVPGWVKEAERIGGADSLLGTLVPREGERDDVLDYIKRVAKEYDEAMKEIAERENVSGAGDPGSMQKLEDARKRLEGMEEIAKVLRISWDDFLGSSKKSTGGDPELEALKERLRLMKEAYGVYEKFQRLVGDEKAARITGGMFDGVFPGGVSREAYRGGMMDMEKELRQMAPGKERDSLLNDIVKTRMGLDEEELRESLDGVKEMIAETVENWDFYKDLKEKGVSTDKAMVLAFGGKVDFKNVVEELREELRKALEGSGVSVAEVMGMDGKEVKLRFGEDSTVAAFHEEIKKQEKEMLSDTDRMIAEVLAKYATYYERRKAMEEEFEKERDTLVSQGASEESLANLEYAKEEALAKLDEEVAMKNEEFQRWAAQIAEMGIDALKSELEKAKKLLAEMEKSDPTNPKNAEARAGINIIEEAIAEYEPGEVDRDWQKLYRTLQKVEKEFKEVGDAIGGAAGEAIGAAGEITTSLLSMVNGIITLSTSGIHSVEGVSKAAATAIKAVETASVILAIVSAALNVATKIVNFFKDDDGMKEYERTKEIYEGYIDTLDRVIDKQLELAESLGGKNAQNAYEEAKKLYDSQAEAAREVGKAYLNAGASKGFLGIGSSSSHGVKMRNNITAEAWTQAADALGMSVNEFKDLLGGRMTGLFDLEYDQLVTLMEKSPLFWAQLDEEARNYLNSIIEYGDAVVEASGEAINQLMGDGFASAAEDMGDSIAEAFQTGEEAAWQFNDVVREVLEDMAVNMARELYLKEVFSDLQDDVEQLTGTYKGNKWFGQDNFMGDLVNAAYMTDLKSLMERYNGRLEGAEENYEKFLEMMQTTFGDYDLFQPDKSGSNSLSRGIANITEDQADLLASYINAMRQDLSVVRLLWERFNTMFMENGNLIAEQQLEQLNRIAENTARNAEAAEDMRDLLTRATTSGSGVKVNV